jgi:hypothetical protein
MNMFNLLNWFKALKAARNLRKQKEKRRQKLHSLAKDAVQASFYMANNSKVDHDFFIKGISSMIELAAMHGISYEELRKYTFDNYEDLLKERGIKRKTDEEKAILN